jgi:lipoate-protein ligase B
MTPELEALLDRCRTEKAELRRCEQTRVALGLEPESAGRDHMLAELDRRIAVLTANRTTLLHDIAKLTPGYSIALRYAVEMLGFAPTEGTVRFNRRRGGCYTFGLPGQPVMAVWVDVASGAVLRAEPLIGENK